jgi:hypothetical protein
MPNFSSLACTQTDLDKFLTFFQEKGERLVRRFFHYENWCLRLTAILFAALFPSFHKEKSETKWSTVRAGLRSSKVTPVYLKNNLWLGK